MLNKPIWPKEFLFHGSESVRFRRIVSISSYKSILLSIFLYFYLFIYPSFFLSIYFSIYTSLFISIFYLSYLFIYIYPSIYDYCPSRYRPDLLPWESLDPECAEDNLQLGFDILEAELGLQPVITASEVIL